MIDATIRTRFFAKTIPEPNSGCLLWTGATTKRTMEYGSVWFAGKTERANRVAWILEHGSIPDGIQVLHRCDTSLCVNVDHLFLGTCGDNVRDCRDKGRLNSRFCAIARTKTHCAQGHPYDERNTTRRRSARGRVCRECRRIWNKRHWKPKRRVAA
jgi:hypothetical protein